MSRSYKKTPIHKYAPEGNWGQKQANRRVRRFKGDLSDGMMYKKLYCAWDIHDCVSRYTLDDALSFRTQMISDCCNGRYTYHAKDDEQYFNIHKCILHWKKYYYFK